MDGLTGLLPPTMLPNESVLQPGLLCQSSLIHADSSLASACGCCMTIKLTAIIITHRWWLYVCAGMQAASCQILRDLAEWLQLLSP